jgi:thiol-disulfide isomerase/thioredoxin
MEEKNMKKILSLSILLILVITLSACSNKDALNFKKDYESLNGKKGEDEELNRTVKISSDNPYKKVKAKTIVNLIESKKTFYVFFGFPECPWCRSVIEKSIEVAKRNNIKTIYYVNALNIRDKYEIKNGKAVKLTEGTKDYQQLIKSLSNVLAEYKLTDENNKTIDINEKRIYAPNFIYIKNGKAVKLTEGISSKQTKYNQKLTKEILNDEDKIFTNFFKN